MAIKLTTPRLAAQEGGLKILVHAPAKAGKTKLIETLLGCADITEICIISAEKGLLSIASGPLANAATIEISEWRDLDEAYDFITTRAEAQNFKWIILDSFSDIAEICLSTEKKRAPDPRQAYGAANDKAFIMLRKFRDMPGKHVYFIAKQKKEKDEQTGASLYSPMMPGQALGQGISYLFDEVFALRIMTDANGVEQRVLQTGRDLQYDAGDRSGMLAMYEPANLAHIKAKIFGATQPAQAAA